MPERNENVWAPWRMEYIRQASQPQQGWFLCAYAGRPQDDPAHYVLWRSGRVLVLLNRYPYTNGHLLVAPLAHVGTLDALDEGVLCEMTVRLRDAVCVLREVVQAEGFNIGMNLGRCAGAGLPDHVHWHVVPRWSADTNFMSVVGNARVIPQALDEVYDALRRKAHELGLTDGLVAPPAKD